jgi:hypothetical protein
MKKTANSLCGRPFFGWVWAGIEPVTFSIEKVFGIWWYLVGVEPMTFRLRSRCASPLSRRIEQDMIGGNNSATYSTIPWQT